MIRARRAISDTLISIAALTVLLVVLLSMNDRARQQVSDHLSDGGAREGLAQLASNARAIGGAVVSVARYQSIEHAPVVIFVVAGCVLVVFMLRV